MQCRWINQSVRFVQALPAWLLLAAAIIACSGAKPDAPQHDRNLAVYVVNHGWHTGIVIARENLGPDLEFLKRHFDDAEWYEIGWGDRAFYRAERPSIMLALRAGVVPTDSVLHVVALPQSPHTHFRRSRVIELAVDAAGHERMAGAIAAYFKYDKDDDIMPAGKGLYGHSLFFEATGHFHALNTCNTWTARMLARAGVPIRTFMTLRAEGVMKQLESIAIEDTGRR